MSPSAEGSGSAPVLRVDHRVVLEATQGEEARHESAHAGFRSTDRDIQDMVSGWVGLGSRVFGGHWDSTSGNLVGAFDDWSTRNANTSDSMGEYTGKDGEGADHLDAVNEDIAAVMAKVRW